MSTTTVTTSDFFAALSQMTDAGEPYYTTEAYGIHVAIVRDAVYVTDFRAGQTVEHKVPNYGVGIYDLAARPGLRIGMRQLFDGDRVLNFFDPADDNFGYALNMDDPMMSEWGFIP